MSADDRREILTELLADILTLREQASDEALLAPHDAAFHSGRLQGLREAYDRIMEARNE